MKKLFIAVACVAVMVLGGCISDCGQCGADNKPAVQTPGYAGKNSSFGDEQYVWESWQYGTNRVDQAK